MAVLGDVFADIESLHSDAVISGVVCRLIGIENIRTADSRIAALIVLIGVKLLNLPERNRGQEKRQRQKSNYRHSERGEESLSHCFDYNIILPVILNVMKNP